MVASLNRTSTSISASTTSANVALPTSSNEPYLAICNPTTAIAFVRTGTSAPTAVTTDNFVGPSSTKVFRINPQDTFLAVILSTGTGTIYACRQDSE